MKRTLVIGLGVSGKAVADYLLRKGIAVIGVDQKAGSLPLEELVERGLQVETDLASFEEIEEVVVSPGIPFSHPLVQRAKLAGLKIVGEAQFALERLENRCIGITGSNGKTTTVLLLEHVLQSAGRKARALGNVGKSLTGYLQEVDAEETLVVELSSFQLQSLEVRCFEAAAILNITQNHLDWHSSMEEYVRAKARIQECLVRGGELFLSEQVAMEYGSLFKDFAPISKIRYTGRGALGAENVSAAFALCAFLGISKEEFERSLATFRKPPHRVEWVAEIDGIAYYNDSKATSVEAVLYAVSLFERPLIILAGGKDKGVSYVPWVEPFQRKIKKVIAFGQAAPLMEKELASKVCFERVATLQEAFERANKQAQRGDVILLSPGCSSYDQFRNYEHRGEEFKRMVEEYGSQENNTHRDFH